ncbi:hypothetical protein MRX96_013659 [Rhipicephalus microplus]
MLATWRQAIEKGGTGENGTGHCCPLTPKRSGAFSSMPGRERRANAERAGCRRCNLPSIPWDTTNVVKVKRGGGGLPREGRYQEWGRGFAAATGSAPIDVSPPCAGLFCLPAATLRARALDASTSRCRPLLGANWSSPCWPLRCTD